MANSTGPRAQGGPPAGARASRMSKKSQICDVYIENLRQRAELTVGPELIHEVRKHFESLPTLYAIEVNTEGLDVLNHKQLLDSARQNPMSVCFQVRIVDAVANAAEAASNLNKELGQENSPLSPAPISPGRNSLGGEHRGSFARLGSSYKALPRPAFGSSPSLSGLGGEEDMASESNVTIPCYEVTIASKDQAKLLSRLSNALGDLGLNIREAHAFNTKDGFSLDVFVVDGWSLEALEGLEDALAEKFGALFSGEQPQSVQVQPAPAWLQQQVAPFQQERAQAALSDLAGALQAPPLQPIVDDWELNPEQLKLVSIIGSGSFGDLYKGYYAGQDVAVKILKDVHENEQQYQEFLQEVSIMRKVRHKNVVQFIGACTRKPNLCIVFEFMQGGSVFDYMRRHGPLSIEQVIRVGVEVARGMDYLHQMRIVHRDLKAANLLMDEHGTVKIADFGVARVVTNGVMTAETGTYRWMAPEVIEHRPYSHKADVFSFGILLWELITGKVPHAHLTPLQAAVGVVQKGLRPPIPETVVPPLADVMRACWRTQPEQRPEFAEIAGLLGQLKDQLLQQATEAKKGTGGLFARFRRTQTAKGGPGVSGPQPSSVSMSRDSSAPMHLG